MLIDSHCHLNYKEYANLEEVKKKALEYGVDTFIAIGASDNINSCTETVNIAEKNDNIFATVGFHPHDAELYNEKNEKQIIELLKSPKVVAIGEIGLDYYYEHSERKIQKEVFVKQLNLASKNKLPVVIHTRDAEEDTIEILEKFHQNNPNTKILFHCFSGTEKLANFGQKIGAFFSFSGIITFKKADDIREIAKNIPLEKILVETDSPYLTPVPYRGKKNHPAYVKIVAEKLAEIKNLDYETIEKTTRKNTVNFFNLDI